MADTFELELVSPESLLLSEPVEMVVVPGEEGDFGVLAGHTPVISNIRPGTLAIFEGGSVTNRVFLAGGFAEVTKERCTILAEGAMPVDDIDRSAVEQEIIACVRMSMPLPTMQNAAAPKPPSPSQKRNCTR